MLFGQGLLVAPISTLRFFVGSMTAWMKIIFLASFEGKCGHILTSSCEGEVLMRLPGLAFERNWTHAALPSLFLQARMLPR